MSGLLFDTCLLIDVERELRRGSGRALAFLGAHAAERPWITWTVAGEFAEGFGGLGDPACAGLLERFDILPMDAGTADRYGRITSYLRREGRLIGANDLWIAAAALANDLPLVSRDGGHFRRVPGLKVMSY